ncbi:MAG: TolC family protein [Thermoflavifilum sp.]|nr:TolC family protein [Thermoflavifilum sp.]
MRHQMKIFSLSGLGIILLGWLWGCSGGQAYAQGLSLSQVLDSVNQRNAGLQAYVYSQQAAIQRALAAKGWPVPEVGVGASEFPYPGMSKTGNLSARKMPMIRLQQTLPIFSHQQAQANYERSLIPQYADQQAVLRNQLYFQARTAYMLLWISEHKLQAVREQQEQLQLLIRILEKNLSYNKAQPFHIYQARANLADLQNQEVALVSERGQQSAVLNGLMNKPVGALLQIDTSVPPLAHAVLGPVDTAYLLHNRSDIRLMTHQALSLSWQQQLLKAELKPQIGLTWDNMRMPDGMYMYNLMAMISLPQLPWAARTQRYQILAVGEEIKALRQQQQEQLFEAQGSIAQLQHRLQSLSEQVRAYQQQVLPAYEQAYQSYVQALGELTGDAYETLQAWQEWTAKKLTYWDLMQQYLQTQIDLLTALEQ